MNKIFTEKAPKALGPYSQAIEINGFLFTSGQLGINPKTLKMENGIENQSEAIFKNIFNIIEEAGYNTKNIVKTTCFLKNIKDFSIFNSIYSKYITEKPARTCVEVSNLPSDALVEVDVIVSK